MWKFESFQKLGFETLSNVAKEDSMKKFKLAEQKSIKRSDKEYQIFEARRRNIKHQKSANNKAGIDLYKDKKQQKAELDYLISDIDIFSENTQQFQISVLSFDR